MEQLNQFYVFPNQISGRDKFQNEFWLYVSFAARQCKKSKQSERTDYLDACVVVDKY